MKLLLAALALLASVGACGDLADAPPSLSLPAAARLAMAADEAVDTALATGETSALREVFTAPAATVTLRQLRALQRTGEHLERKVDVRRVVHSRLGPGWTEVVLEVLGAERLVTRDAVGGWSRFVRQWDARLEFDGTRWRVARSEDLPPPRWWR